jgi:D-glycero-alpha-D-manno-heptose-7-phosphate kinase
MIISRTPLRLSFVGGGTDLPDFYEEHGGAVVSTSLDKWIHVVVAPRFEGDVRVSYSRTEIVPHARAVEHELVREAMRMTGVPRGVDIVTLADVPSQGTGVGSSSSVTVGLLNALYAFQGVYKAPVQLAEEAARIEIEILGKPIGRQDQYAAAVGGFNFIEFLPRGGGVKIEPVITPSGTLKRLQRSLMMFYTGQQRSADGPLSAQRQAVQSGQALQALCKMRDMAFEFRERLTQGDVDGLAPLLLENWQLKRGLAEGISSVEIDRWFERALAAGAMAGKILGAGAGGFLLLLAAPERQDSVRSELSELRELPVRFSAHGTQISVLGERDL